MRHLKLNSGPFHKVITGLLVLLISIMAVGVAKYVMQAYSAITIPFPTWRPEAFVLDGVMRLAEGDVLYRLIADAPMTVHVYNIFAYAVPALVALPFGSDAVTLLIVGRSISLVSSLALAVLLGWYAHRISSSYLAALFAALLPFIFHEMALPHFFRLRPEAPAIFFSAAAIIFLQLFDDRKTQTLVGVAGLCFLSFLFKQSFIAAPMAIGMYFLLTHRWRCLAIFSMAYGAAVIALFAVMYGTAGYAYFENAFVAMAIDKVSVRTALVFYMDFFFGNSFGLLSAALVALAGAIWRIKSNVLIVCYLMTALLWNVYSSGKTGSSSNYYAEFGIASIIMIMNVFRRQADGGGTPLLKLLVLLPIFVQVLVSAASSFVTSRPPVFFEPLDVNLAPYISGYETNKNQLILHEKIAIQLGNPVGYDWFLLDILIAQGRLDPAPFFQRIRAGEFDSIVFSQQPYSKFERDLYRVVLMSPYQKSYEDRVVMEFRRIQ